MTKRKSTKRALLLSALSLLMCVSMLVGTTFAWFTDSVTSGRNIIQAGNLDINLEYKKVVNGTATDWAPVQGEDEIFDPNALWEPGRVEVVYLKVSNLGSLALKYQLGVNVYDETPGINVAGEAFKLSEHLVFKVVEMPTALTTYTDRQAVQLAAGTEKGLKDYNGTTKPLDAKGGENAEDYVALIVYMPESVGNEANYKTGTTVPAIELGINLFATQYTSEKDSFNEFYDKEATYPASAAINSNAANATILENGVTKVEIPVGAAGGNYKLETTKPVTTEENGNTVATMDITLLRNGVAVTDDGTEYAVSVNIGAGLNLTQIFHAGVEIPATDYAYDIATGELTFKTTHFSPFTFIYNDGVDVTNCDELVAALASSKVVNLKNDIEASSIIFIGEDVQINGNGYKVTSSANRIFRVTTSNVIAVLDNVNMVSTYPAAGSYNDGRGISVDAYLSDVKLVLNDCSVKFTNGNDGVFAVNVSGDGTGHTVVVNGGSYEGANPINVHGKENTIIVKNAVITSIYPDGLGYYAACIWVKTRGNSQVIATGNTFNGAKAVAYSLGSGNTLTEENNTDNTGVCVVGGNDGYSSLEAAFQKASAGTTLYLIKDIESTAGITVPAGVTIEGDGHTITYVGTDYAYHLLKLETDAAVKDVTLYNYRVRTEATTNGTVTLENVEINMTDDLTGLDISRGAGTAKLINVKCKNIQDAAHLDPATQVQVDYDPYGDVLLGGAWALDATNCEFGSLHGWNTRNGSAVSLNNTTCTVFRMHYWSGRTLFIDGVETAWSASGAIPVAHDVGGCWSVQPAFK